MNLSTFTAAVLLLGTVPQDCGVLRDEVACIETNHVYDTEGKEFLCQFCFWDWCDRKGCHRLVDWRLVKTLDRPEWDYGRRCYVLRLKEGDTLREVTAQTARETWTTHDVELADREHWPLDFRRKLSTGEKIERRWTE